MLQSSAFDPVIGVDIHVVGVPAPPAPAPIPTPVPLPFVGVVFDPLGLAVGAAISLAVSDGPGLVLINGMPVTNCGTAVTNVLTLPHASAPGVMFMRNGLPELEGDAELFFGSRDVYFAGSYGVRLGDVALSCSDPNRLPTSVVLAIPKGRPVLNRAPMAPDLAAIAIASAMKGAIEGLGALARRGAVLLRRVRQNSRFFERLSRRLGGCEPPANAGRWRQMWHRGVRFVTGHPVDVVTGSVFTEVVVLELPGPIPLRIERVYESAGSGKRSSLGFGWNHSLDESLWFERGRAVVRLGDGREVEFGLWDLPERSERGMRPGRTIERVIHKLRLTCVAEGRFELASADDLVREYARIPGDATDRLRLVKIRSADGCHDVELSYDENAHLAQARDACGRVVLFVHDQQGRLSALLAPKPHADGVYVHRRFRYDAAGDLVEVVDALGHSWRYAYEGHLLVQETNRAGLSFFFQYDGVGALSKCVRTWGDNGIYDHLISYDQNNRKTLVEDSRGELTIYTFNERNQVVQVMDPLGNTTRYDYHPDSGGEILRVDALGAEHRQRFDEHGNAVEFVAADGAVTSMSYDGYHQIAARDPRGGEWTWRYGPGGRLEDAVSPSGRVVRRSWTAGLLAAIDEGAGRRTFFHYDEHKQLAAVTLANGSDETYRYDGLGRLVEARDAGGGITRFIYDLEGRVVQARGPANVEHEFVYDPEGDLLSARGDGRAVRFEYVGHHRLAQREEAGTRQRWEWDSEGRLRAVINQAGERFEFERDGAGQVIAQTGFDGRTQRYVLDGTGRPISSQLASGRSWTARYDPNDRLLEVRHDDGSLTRFAYDALGLLCQAHNETAEIEFERDADGRVIAERSRMHAGATDGAEIRSRHDAAGERVEVWSSLGARVGIVRTGMGEPSQVFLGEAAEHQQRPYLRLAHDPGGDLRSVRFGNGIELAWTRDDAGRPATRRITRHDPRGAIDLLDRQDYQWRGEMQLARVDDREYGHDARGRLVRAQRGDEVTLRILDAVGNVHRRESQFGPGGHIELFDGHAYDHDDDGNLVRRSTPEGDWTYAWNGHGLLCAIERPDGARIEFEYDAFARRIGRRTLSPHGALERETAFVWDGHVVVHELDSREGLTTWHWLPETATPLVKERDGQRLAIVGDHLGTPTRMYNEAGELCWKASLDIFGEVDVELGVAGDCPWRWPGQYDDGFQGELYNRFRYYSPAQGCYISRDPAGLVAGMHPYAHVPDPLVWLDLFGLTGAYIFKFDSGEMYIGKGPVERARTSQRQRAEQVKSKVDNIVAGAHADYGDSRMGLMVEAELMKMHKFDDGNPDLLNKINSPGKKKLANASPAEKALVEQRANALLVKYNATTGKIC
ncbi:RHS domain-containing protein [Pseudenhygromyxa sp. WMMC2535]|uniref:DUF6531 domain-containing protein n=1 Tax=Pseudenhygromyxa sp. WMMC2535 TaxID=2712867 RepID=UPI001555254D|nr:DUF6531 domain-containing protein [Pseudenhygromyxa sp. WMMC2535]NVB36762.1 RHS domain-containing protein [Pseudenhygromyxa sp. WMMC2535]